MPMTGKCTNIGNCDKADKKELITIPNGLDFVCPERSKPLMVTKSSSGSVGDVRKIAAVVLGLVIILGWFLWSSADKTTPSAHFAIPGQSQVLMQHGTPVLSVTFSPD